MKKISPINRHGFTIIELLVVIAIIALLTGIIMTNLTGSKARARDAKRVSDLGQIQLALEMYYDRCKQYPSSTPLSIGDANGCPTDINLGSFIPQIPSAPTGSPDSTGYEYSPFDANGDSKLDTYLLHVTLEANNPALLDDIDSAPANWISNSNIGDFGNHCQDSGGTYPYQYCLISN